MISFAILAQYFICSYIFPGCSITVLGSMAIYGNQWLSHGAIYAQYFDGSDRLELRWQP